MARGRTGQALSVQSITFSILTVARNAAAHIETCLDSVAAQTHPNVEHVVIDGHSNDGTQAIVERKRTERLAAFVSEPDAGIYDAMNKALKLAKGDYILFLGADDHLQDAGVVADVAQFLGRGGQIDFLYGDLEVRHENGNRSVFRPPEPEGALDLMICGCLPHQATFAHRRVFDVIGNFDTRYKVQADYDWFLRVLGDPVLSKRHIPRVISSFAMGGSSSSLRQGQEETYAIQNAFPIYREADWMDKRLREFQRQLLEYRIQLQAAGGVRPGLLERATRKALELLRR